jgi:hypothetical protein
MFLCVSVDFKHNQPLFSLQITDNGPCNEDKTCSLSGRNSVIEYVRIILYKYYNLMYFSFGIHRTVHRDIFL